jgi:hypothetical protein
VRSVCKQQGVERGSSRSEPTAPRLRAAKARVMFGASVHRLMCGWREKAV